MLPADCQRHLAHFLRSKRHHRNRSTEWKLHQPQKVPRVTPSQASHPYTQNKMWTDHKPKNEITLRTSTLKAYGAVECNGRHFLFDKFISFDLI